MIESLLQVNAIEVYYRDVKVLSNVSVEVGKGEIVTVIGPNGAGKSTLLSTIVASSIRPKDLSTLTVCLSTDCLLKKLCRSDLP